jgi:hypothetical protein
MMGSNFGRYALSISAAAAVLASCGGSQPQLAPSGSTQPPYSVPSYERVRLASAERRFAPKLLYISKFYSSGTDAYTIPGLKYVYSIKGAAGGMCTTGRKTFWIATSTTLAEFDYGGMSPIKILNAPPGAELGDCSIDPTTGNIAAGGVFIWKGAMGPPMQFTPPLHEVYFLGYDGSGNLFVDGFNSSSVPALVELPKGSSTWKTLSLSVNIGFPGGIQWDGTYLAVGDQIASVIYQFTCSRTSCTKEGMTMLDGASDCASFWIDKGTLACGDLGNDDAELWRYPVGGDLYAHIAGVSGATVIVK